MPFARIVEVVAIGRQIFGPQFNAFSKVAGDRVGYPDIVPDAVFARVQSGQEGGAGWAAVGRRAESICKCNALFHEPVKVGSQAACVGNRRAALLVGHEYQYVRS